MNLEIAVLFVVFLVVLPVLARVMVGRRLPPPEQPQAPTAMSRYGGGRRG